MAEAIAPLSGTPHVIAIREMAIDGACGPWSTADTRAASMSRAWGRVGNSPRNISQIISGKVTWPMSSSMGYPRMAM